MITNGGADVTRATPQSIRSNRTLWTADREAEQSHRAIQRTAKLKATGGEVGPSRSGKGKSSA
jgi:hypothetical protein